MGKPGFKITYIQMYGAAGVSQNTILADSYMYARICRIVDGPDQLHINQLGRNLIRQLAGDTPASV